MEQFTVYTDVESTDVRQHIERCAARICPDNYRLVTPPPSHHRCPGGARRVEEQPTPPLSLHACASGMHDNPICADATSRRRPDMPRVTSEPFFITTWEQEQGDVAGMVRNTIPFMNMAECYITQSGDLSSGEVIYALYRRQMPVLSLSLSACSSATCDESTAASAAASTAPATTDDPNSDKSRDDSCDAIQHVLYHSRSRSSFSPSTQTVRAAIDAFFTAYTTPTKGRPHGGSVWSVEGIPYCPTTAYPDARAVSEEDRNSATAADGACLMSCLVEAVDMCVSSMQAILPVVLMDAAGRVCWHYDASRAGAETTEEVRRTAMRTHAPATFAPMCDVLRRVPRACMLTAHEAVHDPRGRTRTTCEDAAAQKWRDGADSPPTSDTTSERVIDTSDSSLHKSTHGTRAEEVEENSLGAILRANPLLPGALMVFNRYENRGLLRALLHRGVTVIFVQHATSSCTWPLVTRHAQPPTHPPPPPAHTDDAAVVVVAKGGDSRDDDERVVEVSATMQLGAAAEQARAVSVDAERTETNTESAPSHLVALRRLEMRWLEMPCPTQTLCLCLHHRLHNDAACGCLWCEGSAVSDDARTRGAKTTVDEDGDANKKCPYPELARGGGAQSRRESGAAVIGARVHGRGVEGGWPGWQCEDVSARGDSDGTIRQKCVLAMVRWLRQVVATV